MNWLRLYHGTCTNPKLAMIANKAGARPCEMTAFWLCLLEYASQQNPRGTVKGIDLELIAFSQEIELETLQRLYKGLEEKRVIVDGRIASWDEHQYEHDPTAAERKRRQRENEKASKKAKNNHSDVAVGHTPITPCHGDVTVGHAPETDSDQTPESEHNVRLDKSNSKPSKRFLSSSERKDMEAKEAMRAAARKLGLMDDAADIHSSGTKAGFFTVGQ